MNKCFISNIIQNAIIYIITDNINNTNFDNKTIF